MQHVPVFGYPTPPASPVFDKCVTPHHLPGQQACPAPAPAPFVPLAPEERLGSFIAGSLQLQGILGTGAYGIVYSAVDVKTNVRFAVKCLSKYNADGTPLDRRQVAFQNREIRLHYLASTHRNVVSMLKIIDNADCIYVILEYCPEGDLFLNITERGHFVGKDDVAKDVFLQILDAVEHCHSLGIYHRDLKPENILVTDQGRTVKLADFGLATASDRSQDYGCGSTFYMSPECLDHSSRRPFYFCAPNDVWSLGVILVNLTCGRNPWKQASFEDSTYRAYVRNAGFLKTILPLSDELNDILGRIFTRDPSQRITLRELRSSILACARFTDVPRGSSCLPTPPASPDHSHEYADCEDLMFEDDEELDFAPLSPTSSDGMSDDGSSCSSMEDLEEDIEDLIGELPEARTPPPPQSRLEGIASPTVFDPEVQMLPFPGQQPVDFSAYPGSACKTLALPPMTPPTRMPLPSPVQPSCAVQNKFVMPHVWDTVIRYAHHAPPLHHPTPFHHQVPLFSFGQHVVY